MTRMNELLFYDTLHSTTVMSEEHVIRLHRVTPLQIKQIKEAGTWERWPYIVAKYRYGFMTPEYKTYLKRLRLSVQIPKRPTEANSGYLTSQLFGTKKQKKQSLIGRFREWIHYHF